MSVFVYVSLCLWLVCVWCVSVCVCVFECFCVCVWCLCVMCECLCVCGFVCLCVPLCGVLMCGVCVVCV